MQALHPTVDETLRLNALCSYNVLDTPNEAQFDDLTLLATTLCSTPIALISLTDEKRQWFKSRVGFDSTEVDRELSFCDQAIRGDAVMEVADALNDDRFRVNPLVTGGPQFRFYAGAPLVDPSGFRLGTLCVLDYVPRALTHTQRSALETLSRVVMRQLELRTLINQREAAYQAAATSDRRIRTITDNLPALISYVDADERYQFCNRHYRTLLELDPQAIIGCSLEEVFGTEAYERLRERVRKALAGERLSFERLINFGGSQGYQQCEYIPEIGADGTVHGFYILATDVTARRVAEQKLADTAHRLRAITDNIPALVTHVDRDERYLFVNNHIGRLFNKDASAMLGRRVQDEHPPERYAVLKPHIDAVFKGMPVRFEGMVVLAGKERFFQTDFLPDRDNDGVVNGFFAMTFEITERKLSEQRRAENEKRLRTITDNVPALIGYIDAQQRLQFCNIHYGTTFNFDLETIIGKELRDVYEKPMYEQMAPHVMNALAGEKVSFERATVVKGKELFQQVEYVPHVGTDGAVNGFYALVTDVTARRVAEQALADSERHLRTITDNLPVAITYLDADLYIRFANATVHAWCGLAHEAMQGKSLAEVVSASIHESQHPYYKRALGGERVEFVLEPNPFYAHRVVKSSLIPDFSMDGKVRGIFCLSSDITAQKQHEEELRRLARFDSLTGLPNRSHLYETLEAAIERAKEARTALAVLFLDIDHFKKINDTIGHQKGDLVLQEFAARLTKAVRAGDLVARLAGDEFIVVLESLESVQEAKVVAGKILKRMNKPWLLNGDDLAVTTSIGIAYDQEHVYSSSDLIAYAHTALYAAKAAGRNTAHASCH